MRLLSVSEDDKEDQLFEEFQSKFNVCYYFLLPYRLLFVPITKYTYQYVCLWHLFNIRFFENIVICNNSSKHFMTEQYLIFLRI